MYINKAASNKPGCMTANHGASMRPTGYSDHVSADERPIISALLKAILAGGNTISIYDGEDRPIERSSSINAIRPELGACGEDWIEVHDAAGTELGYFYMIYNNGSEDDGMVVIADYSSTDFCNDIMDVLYAKYSD
jgi:hypothetical protein